MNKSAKITLIIITILIVGAVIGALGYLISNLNKSNKRIGELEIEISDLNKKSKMENETIEDEETEEDENQNNEIAKLNYREINGAYTANVKDTTGNGETEIRLFLKENGQFQYYMDPNTGSNDEGYYLINENNIILYTILSHGNDVGAKIVNEIINAKINEDKTITIIDKKEGNRTFNKSNKPLQSEFNDISESIINSLKNNALEY